MAKSYYSTVFDYTAAEVWSKIRDFNDDRWSGEVTESSSENGKSGSTVGTIRFHRFGDKTARSDLRAYSDIERFFTYGFVGIPPSPLEDYQATLRVTPVVDGNRAFVEWWATFDCAATEREYWVAFLADSYSRWLAALKNTLK
ncbi:MAG TPA: SRPBCC family protein [Ktedonobacteraceae bacterium]|nr:SRPBCC family protein [Ktedonobacteraceae bacterium]